MTGFELRTKARCSACFFNFRDSAKFRGRENHIEIVKSLENTPYYDSRIVIYDRTGFIRLATWLRPCRVYRSRAKLACLVLTTMTMNLILSLEL